MLLKFVLFTLQKLLLLLPQSWLLPLGKHLGAISYYLFRRRRKIAFDNIYRAYGKTLTDHDAKVIVRGNFQQLALNFVEFLTLPLLTKENMAQIITIHGLDYFKKAYTENGGILVLTMHMGFWELLILAISFQHPLTAVVVKKMRQAAIEELMNTWRRRYHTIVLSGKNLTRPILKLLNNNGLVGIVMDQCATYPEGVIVNFFDQPACTFKSLAILAMRSSAVILPMYCYRDATGHHHIHIDAPLTFENMANDVSRDALISARTQQYANWMETVIRRHPDQWIWTHRRWKR